MQNTRSRPLAALLLAAVLGLVVAGCGDAGLGGPRIGGTPAASVGSFQLSPADLEAEVEVWASNPAVVQQVMGVSDAGAPGRRSAELVAFVLTFRVMTEQAKQLADEQGVTVSEAEIADIETQIDEAFADPTTGRSMFAAYDSDFRRYLFGSLAFQQTLNTTLFAGGEAPAVTVNPRYGEAVDAGSGIVEVVPPSGPRPEPLTFG